MKWNKEQQDEIQKLWNLNYTVEEIAIALDRTFFSVKGYIDRKRVLFPKRIIEDRVIQKIASPRASIRTEIEDPPKMIPIPEGALSLPWVELSVRQCQWGISNDFYEPVSNTFLCCGLPVVRDRCCEYHLKYRKKEK